MFKFFTSVKLTLALLLLLAFISIGGTISPVEAQRFELFYQSLWFRLLLGLLALNLICCTIKTLPHKWQQRRRLFHSLGAQAEGSLINASSLEALATEIASAGYRTELRGELLLAERGCLGRFGSTLVHVAILLIMLGALLGETGFVGTINTYLHQPNQQYYDWDAQQQRDLGFVFRVDAFQLRYYPIQLRFELLDAATGESLGQLLRYDNEAFAVPDSSLTVQIRGFDPDARILTMDVLEQGIVLGQYRVGDQSEQFGDLKHPSFRVNNVEFRDPILKQMEAQAAILEQGQVVKQGLIKVNDPLTYRGVSFYQTAYGNDAAGQRSVGFQLSEDPGEWLVWTATVLLMIGFGLAFYLPRRAFGVKSVAGQLQLFPLEGWQRDAGRVQLRQLKERLSAKIPPSP